AFSNLNDMMQELEEFLVIPPQQKEINRRQTAAVLALEDVEVQQNVGSDCKDRTCCICLNDYDSDEESEVVEDRMVKLPCSHQFHEDCVIDWFNTSTTCPLCRQPAYTKEQWSFDVSIH
ncbi:Kazal-like serine protease inhibitor, partial [Phytophthora megakarya]